MARTKVSRNIRIYEESEVDEIDGTILICINFDGLQKLNQLKHFFKNIFKMKKGSLLIIESTLIPGTWKNSLSYSKKRIKKKKIGMKNFSFGYSYERIMPGND